ncbi:hypothetical protein [Nitrobacter sp. TKz-YC02]
MQSSQNRLAFDRNDELNARLVGRGLAGLFRRAGRQIEAKDNTHSVGHG